MKRAYHDILLPDGTLQRGPVVVETSTDNQLICWHRLEQEEPFTEWIGGTYEIKDNKTNQAHIKE